jgi:hypothetical protein
MNIGLPFSWSNKTQSLWNIASNKKAIRTQGPFMDAVIPPILHQLYRHKLFNFIAKAHIGQLQAIVKCLMNHPDGGGDRDFT